MERGEDVVELLTVAQCGNKQSSSNSSFTSLSDSELSQVTAMDSVPEEKRLPLIDNATLLVYDLSVRKYTSLTNEGMCVCVCMYMLFVCVCVHVLFVCVQVHMHAYTCTSLTNEGTCTCTCGKVTALGVLCCFALFVCLTLLASSFSSLI